MARSWSPAPEKLGTRGPVGPQDHTCARAEVGIKAEGEVALSGGGGGQRCSRRNFGLGHVSCAAALGLGPSKDPRVTRPSALRVLQAPSHLTAPRSRPALDTRFPTPEAPEVLTGLFPRFPPKQNCVAPVTCRLGKRFILGKPRELVSFQPCPHPGVHVHLNSPQHTRHKVYSLERTRG